MSCADKIFVAMCEDILANGTSTEGEKVRPHWEDGASAYTIKKFGVVSRYDLSKEFPAITLRKTAVKTCTEEMLWIWQRKSNNIQGLKQHSLGRVGGCGRIHRQGVRLSARREAPVQGRDDGSGEPCDLRSEEQPVQPPHHDKYLCASGSA